MRKATVIKLLDLQPNNWYISREKLDRVRKAWDRGLQDNLPPVLVSYIDGQPGLIDGHSRAFAAYERGETEIRAYIEGLDDIEGSSTLYVHIHNEGPRLGITSVADLADRIEGPEGYQRKWIGYCTDWLKENSEESDSDV